MLRLPSRSRAHSPLPRPVPGNLSSASPVTWAALPLAPGWVPAVEGSSGPGCGEGTRGGLFPLPPPQSQVWSEWLSGGPGSSPALGVTSSLSPLPEDSNGVLLVSDPRCSQSSGRLEPARTS